MHSGPTLPDQVGAEEALNAVLIVPTQFPACSSSLPGSLTPARYGEQVTFRSGHQTPPLQIGSLLHPGGLTRTDYLGQDWV